MKLGDNKESDQVLILKIKQGNERAFSTLVNRWYKRMYNYAYRYKADDNFAQEVVQKAFIQVYQKIDQLQDESKFKPWFYRVAHNMCISEGRTIKRLKNWMMTTDAMPNVSDAINHQHRYESNEKQLMMRKALNSIPKEQKEVIVLKEYEGLKFREIAEMLGESESTIKSRMYYGLNALKKVLTKQEWTKELYYE